MNECAFKIVGDIYRLRFYWFSFHCEKRCVYECFCFYLDCYAVSVAIADDDAYALAHSLTHSLSIVAFMLLLCCYFWVACICYAVVLVHSFTLASSCKYSGEKIDKNLPCTHFPLSGSQNTIHNLCSAFRVCLLSLTHSLCVCVCVYMTAYGMLH